MIRGLVRKMDMSVSKLPSQRRIDVILVSDYVHLASLVAAVCCFTEVQNGHYHDISLNLPIWTHIEAHGKRLAEVITNFTKTYSKSNPRNRALHSRQKTLINYQRTSQMVRYFTIALDE